MSTRLAELSQNLDATHQRIRDALTAAGRPLDAVSLVVVTKFFPASDVRLLARLGVIDVGENRHQEAEAKAAECADLDLRWHFIGGLQTNKAAVVARYASVVESVDRPELLPRLSRGAEESGKTLDVLLQVSLDPAGRDHRSGVDPADLLRLADSTVATPGLALRGIMAVAPLDEEPIAAFSRLAEIRAEFLGHHPEATTLSAGMSGDLEEAISIGATHVRVGSAILGSRPHAD